MDRVVWLPAAADRTRTSNKSRRFARHRDAVRFLQKLEQRYPLAWAYLEQRPIFAGKWRVLQKRGLA